MATYFLFGKYSPQVLGQISADRTKKANDIIAKLGGKAKSMYALLGEKDLVFIVDLPGTKEAIKASLALAKQMGIGFSTSEAVSIEEFDKLAKEA
ncbi:MAG TPA: GYD domain-containing protein [Candidatus Omnitrophota bacterium]|nr:GYD domain-containing protein [Candidatus Omnitrophota bacterium]